MRRHRLILLCLSILMGALLAPGQNPNSPDPGAPRPPGRPPGDPYFGKKDKKPDNTRMLSGAVRDRKGDLVEGAVVQLKDTKTLEIRSFITLNDGLYRFHGLSTETDYEVQAAHKDTVSGRRRLSVYDSRKEAVINLKLDKARDKGDESS